MSISRLKVGTVGGAPSSKLFVSSFVANPPCSLLVLRNDASTSPRDWMAASTREEYAGEVLSKSRFEIEE